MYKLIASARETDGLSIGFDHDRGRRQRELTNNKTQKGKFHFRIMLRDLMRHRFSVLSYVPTMVGIINNMMNTLARKL